MKIRRDVPRTPTATSPWWAELYDEHLALVLLERRSETEVAATLDFLQEELELGPGSTALDQCCGVGSLAVPLAERGVAVFGVELIESYVQRAREEALRRRLGAHFECADAFEYRAPQPCDGAYNWWTSFGYAPTDAENRRMIELAFESLRPGGRFALDTMNLPGVLSGFQRVMLDRRQTPEGEVVLVRECEIDWSAGLLRMHWTYHLPGGSRREQDSALRLYLPHQLVEMLRICGFEDVVTYGGIDRAPLHRDSGRCLCVGRRP